MTGSGQGKKVHKPSETGGAKIFEYSEVYRKPKTTPETIVKLEREILDLQKKIFAKAALGCGW
jgi:hypothetical protein